MGFSGGGALGSDLTPFLEPFFAETNQVLARARQLSARFYKKMFFFKFLFIQHWEAIHIQSKTTQWKSIVGVSDSDNRFYLFNLALRSTIKVARIFDTRSLVTLIKITSRKNNPEILTFKFGSPEKFNALDKITADALKSAEFEFDCVLKLYMPGSAGDAARDIKMRIVNAIEKTKYSAFNNFGPVIFGDFQNNFQPNALRKSKFSKLPNKTGPKGEPARQF